jgi:hypothetical protein
MTNLPLDREATRTPAALPHRGLIVAAIAVGLGICLINPIGRGISGGDLAILGVMAATAMIGANEARRLVHAREETKAEVSDGAWMTIIVGPQGPAETAGQIVKPKAPPRNDPERRSLARRARERQLTGDGKRR